jgi:adenylosuccinate lyase
MRSLWSEEKKYETWLLVEVLACEAQAELGLIPDEAVTIIRDKARVDAQTIHRHEKVTRHDVIAFLQNVEESVGEASCYVHLGLTSSDILDTAAAIIMAEASDIIVKDIKDLLAVLKERAIEHKQTLMIGRSHGIHAEPVTFGLKLALWYAEMERNLARMERAKDAIAVGKISGAVGTFANIPPEVEAYVCRRAGLKPASVSNQIVQRDRYAEFMGTLALIAGSLEKFAVEIRHLQRTEVREVEEFFSHGQKGSSAMPHKKNPITSEQISGLARLIRTNALASYENMALWHERDISHSSVERVILPDSTTLIDYMLVRMRGLIKNLVVYPDRMRENLQSSRGLIFSQRVLLESARKGSSRKRAYEAVQRNAMRVWQGEGDFLSLLLKDTELSEAMAPDEIKACFDLSYHTRHLDEIFKRVFDHAG